MSAVRKFMLMIFAVTFLSPIKIGLIRSYHNYKQSSSILNNVTYLGTWENFLKPDTIYCINNTINTYVTAVFNKHPARNTNDEQICNRRNHYDNTQITEYLFEHLQTTVSVPQYVMVNLTKSKILLPRSLLTNVFEVDYYELIEFLREKLQLHSEKHIMQRASSYMGFKIEHGIIPKETYPVICYYVDSLDESSYPSITYIAENPDKIAEAKYPIDEPICMGVLISIAITVIPILLADIINED